MKLPPPPAEPPVITDATGLAPAFRRQLADVMLGLAALGWRPVLRETLRTAERATWLYGFGREWDDGRGIVTYAPNALKTWHHYGLAADVGDRRYEAGSEPAEFWRDVGTCARSEALTWGGSWQMADKPHVQFGPPMRDIPSDRAAELLATGGLAAVWREVGADL